jgi:hypothetical protein
MTLRAIAAVPAVLVAAGALLAWRRAPAVTVALATGLASAMIAYAIARGDGPRGVPAVVTEWFSFDLRGGRITGVVGLIALDLVAIAVLLWFAPGPARRPAGAVSVSS